MTNTAAKKLVWQIKSRSETQVEIEIRCFEKQKNTTYLLSLNIPFTDTASTENAIHCAVLLWHLGYDLPSINQKISQLQNIQMRLELKEGINDCLLIDDSYNNDLAGLKIALDFVEQQTTDKPRTVILSDMLQIGNDTQTLYREIADLLESKKISRLIGIGEDMQRYAAFFENKNINAQFFATTADFVESRLVFQQELILVKGARKFAFEQIIQLLQRKLHGTRLEINLEALSYNLNMYKSLLKPSTRVMVMVKSFAYGSGSYEVASLLQYHQVDYLAVAYTDEAVFLRQKGIRVPIMVMNLSVESLSVFLQYPSIEPVVYSESMLHQVAAFAEKKRTKIAVHLEIDTGMHRLGFAPDNLVLQLLTKYKTVLEVKSIFTHLAAADEPKHTDFTRQQLDVFVEFAQKVEQCLAYRIIKHALNSPGITAFPEYQMDMVRLGIGLYGIDVNHKLRLQPISTLKTTISQIKIVPATDTIGYGRHGKLRQDTPIGIIAIGYGDGYDRRFSRGIGKVMINNKLAPVIGNVCMDMTMIDLSGIEAKEGDEVTIFGENPTISTLAEAIGTISYEILTGISERVKRVFYAG
jgi:alanine racemase